MISPYNANTDILVDIWLRASLKAHNFIDPNLWHDNAEAMRDRFLRQTENYVFTNSEGAVTGFLALNGNHIEALFVDPAHQGKGVGRALIDHAKQLRGELTLAVYERNGKAVVFYHRNHFAVREQRTDTLTGEYELVMEFSPF